MANYKTDVRIVKTKDRLKNSLLALLKEKNFEDITISEICLKASVNRNTFYSHYQSVKDLLDEIEAQFLEMLLSKIRVDSESVKDVSEIMAKILICVRENKELCKLLFDDNGDKNFLRTIVMFALPSAVQNWSYELNIPEDKATKLYYFLIGGSVNVIEQWLKQDCQEPPIELAASLNELILYGQNAYSNTNKIKK